MCGEHVDVKDFIYPTCKESMGIRLEAVEKKAEYKIRSEIIGQELKKSTYLHTGISRVESKRPSSRQHRIKARVEMRIEASTCSPANRHLISCDLRRKFPPLLTLQGPPPSSQN